MTRAFIGAVLALALVSPAAAADTYVIDTKHSEVSFQVRHFVTKVRGNFKEFAGTITIDKAKPQASSVEFTVQAASIDTDVPNRDTHLRGPDFFDTAKYPTLTFKSTSVVPKGGDKFEVTGDLSMHGVTKAITVPVSFLGYVPGKTEKAGFEATATINRKDFGIVWNRALDNGGMMLSDEVWVSINIEADKKVDAPAVAPPAK